tara:strand:- start:71 stop:523 length:453 start_codon:yes stop_codon:yes gene_type:complete
MAIIIQNPNEKKSQISSENKNKKMIGLKLPLTKGSDIDGYFDSTTLTIDAVKENIRNLILTRRGERIFHPDLGLGLEDLLFENITPELIGLTQDSINDTIKKWLPFITINKIDIIEDTESIPSQSIIHIYVEFFMNETPNMMESVEIIIK